MTKLCLFSSCLMVKGNQRSIICDTNRYDFEFIPNSLAQLLEEEVGKTKNEILEKYSEYQEVISEYFDFLEDKEFIFWAENPEFFPKIEFNWHSPSKISNAIIDIRKGIDFNIGEIYEQLDNLGCTNIQLRFFEPINIENLDTYLEETLDKMFRSIEIILPLTSELERNFKSIIDKHRRIISITLTNASENKLLYDAQGRFGNVVMVKNEIRSEIHCGNFHLGLFMTNIELFTESQYHNTCLNRKISIDVDGNIKNCPSMAQSFGNIRDTTLEEVLAHPDFKKYWNVKKDHIAVCRDCEFRHICTDCRAYIENPEDMYSKPLKCGYNPYTAEWEEWSTNPLKQKAIAHYGMQALVKNTNE